MAVLPINTNPLSWGSLMARGNREPIDDSTLNFSYAHLLWELNQPNTYLPSTVTDNKGGSGNFYVGLITAVPYAAGNKGQFASFTENKLSMRGPWYVSYCDTDEPQGTGKFAFGGHGSTGNPNTYYADRIVLKREMDYALQQGTVSPLQLGTYYTGVGMWYDSYAASCQYTNGNQELPDGTYFPTSSYAEIFNDYKHNIAYGAYSHVEGGANYADINTAYSHVEGYRNAAYNKTSHAEGENTTAYGRASHTEGQYTVAYREASHAEGYRAKAYGNYSHAEGYQTTASGDESHAEGYATKAYRDKSHAEGFYTIAYGWASHAEGDSTKANGQASHGEGENTTAYGRASHAEGYEVKAYGDYSHAEGDSTKANGQVSHAEGQNTVTYGRASHGEGNWTVAYGEASHAEGDRTIVTSTATASHAEGQNTVTYGWASHAEGYRAKAYGEASHAEGYEAKAYKKASHAEGDWSVAYGNSSHAEGRKTVAYGQASHTEGFYTITYGEDSHAEGAYTIAYGYASSAHNMSGAYGDFSTSFNIGVTYGAYSVAANYSIANGAYSTAIGKKTSARGEASHTSGFYTETNNTSEFATGSYNRSYTSANDPLKSGGTLFTIGDGNGTNPQTETSTTYRHNVVEIHNNGAMVKNGPSYFNNDIYGPISFTYVEELGPLAKTGIVLRALLELPDYHKPTTSISASGTTGNVEVGTSIVTKVWTNTPNNARATYKNSGSIDWTKTTNLLDNYSHVNISNAVTSYTFNQFNYNPGNGTTLSATYPLTTTNNVSSFTTPTVVLGEPYKTYNLIGSVSGSFAYQHAALAYFPQLVDKGVYVTSTKGKTMDWFDDGTTQLNTVGARSAVGYYRIFAKCINNSGTVVTINSQLPTNRSTLNSGSQVNQLFTANANCTINISASINQTQLVWIAVPENDGQLAASPVWHFNKTGTTGALDDLTPRHTTTISDVDTANSQYKKNYTLYYWDFSIKGTSGPGGAAGDTVTFSITKKV